MAASVRSRRHRRLKRPASRLNLEFLETRSVPAGVSWPGLLNPVAEAEPNGTLDVAQPLGDLTTTPLTEVVGNIGSGAAGNADVDWYTFSLDSAAQVRLATLDQGAAHSLVSILSLYNNDPFDFADPYNPLGHRLLAQDDGAAHGGDAGIDALLGPGTYYAAVSGSGNRYFQPFLAGSGYAGSTGDYGLQITAADAGIAPTDGPAVLSVDPAPDSVLSRSPFLIHVGLSQPLDPGTFVFAAPGQAAATYSNPAPGQTVELRYNSQANDFGAGNYVDIPITVNPSASSTELLVAPTAPLAPGYYQLFLAGDGTGGAPALASPADANGNRTFLGQNGQDTAGADFTAAFQVNGIEGETGATAAANTLNSARELGDVTGSGLLQIPGAIGLDPTDTTLFNATAVELYHFQVQGTGRFALTAEVFAGRIGSPLDPVLTLLRYDPTSGQLSLVGWNDNTLNPSMATQGPPNFPLANDAALFTGLAAGDYYLAVSSSGTSPNTSPGLLPGTDGAIDPSAAFTSPAGATTGPYFLNLGVQPWNTPPAVLAVSPAADSTTNAPPTQVVVRFSEPVDLQELAYQHDQAHAANELGAVFIQGADGNTYYPRLQSYDANTNTATFLMLDALPNGVNRLHLSGPLGITDLAGNPLPGNNPDGDYVASFTVNGPQRGSPGDPLTWQYVAPANGGGSPQDLGALFPHELQTGVNVVRSAGAASNGNTVDSYQFQVLQGRPYFFNLTQASQAGLQVTLTTATGAPVALLSQGNGSAYLVSLDPGTYTLQLSGWTAHQSNSVAYHLVMVLGPSQENPTPLTVRPSPAYRIILADPTPPPSTNSNPPPPPSSSPGSGPTASNPPSNTPPPSSPPDTPTPPLSAPPAVEKAPAPPPTPAPSPPQPPAPPSPVVSTPPPASSPIPAPAASTPPPPSAPVITGPSVPDAPPRLILVVQPVSVPTTPGVQIATRDTIADFRSLAGTLTDSTATRGDGPAAAPSVLTIIGRDAAVNTQFYLSVPTTALSGLSATPVGGLRGTSQNLDAVASQRLQITVSPTNLIRPIRAIWQQTVDSFFADPLPHWNWSDLLRLWEAMFQMPTPSDQDGPAQPKQGNPAETDAASREAVPASERLSGIDWAWASGLFVLGMAYQAEDPKQSARRTLLGQLYQATHQ